MLALTADGLPVFTTGMDEARYSVTVMPDGSVRLYPGKAMSPEDMTPAAVAYAAVVKALEGHES